MRRLPTLLALLALLAAVAAVVVLLLGRPAPPTPEIPMAIERPGAAPVVRPSEPLPRGGVYAGVVVDAAGAPVSGADVLLVAYDTGDVGARAPILAPPSGSEEPLFDPTQLAIVGFRTAAEGKTDAGGRFRIAADADSAIRVVAAWRMGYMPALVGVKAPGEGIRVVLPAAGQLTGTVVDAGTNEPVAGAKVSIYLQQKTQAPLARPGESAGSAGVRGPVSPFAVAQTWVAKELGARVWGLPWEGDSALHLWTGKDGRFRFGPTGDEVQLEVILSHPDYMWTEFDTTEAGHARRLVIGPGQSVERTYRLEHGKSIAGRVVDEVTGRGIADVRVAVEHVAQYKQHWMYREQQRLARTDRDGRFRVGGLSFGPYAATLTHAAFGTEYVSSVPEGATDLRWEVRRMGGIEGTVEGLREGRRGTVELVLEALEAGAEGLSRQTLRPVLGEGGRFLASRIEPGRYQVWVQAEGKSSMPAPVEVVGAEVVKVTFALGGGGTLRLGVLDTGGRAIDPASVLLLRPAETEGGSEVALGQLVTRGGRLEAEGIAPGRYVAEVVSPGYLPSRTGPFQVAAERATDAGDVTLVRQAWIRIQGVTSPRDATPGRVTIEVQEGADGPFRPLAGLTGGEIPVRPGRVTVRAQAQDGTSFEERTEVAEGQTLTLEVVLR